MIKQVIIFYKIKVPLVKINLIKMHSSLLMIIFEPCLKKLQNRIYNPSKDNIEMDQCKNKTYWITMTKMKEI